MLSLAMGTFQLLVAASAVWVLLTLGACTSGEVAQPMSGEDARVRDGGQTGQDGSTRWPPNQMDAAVGADASSGDASGEAREDLTLAGGDVSGRWCGNITLEDTVTVPSGAVLEVCGGSTVEVAEGARVRVDGTLRLEGATNAPIRFSGDGWLGLVIAGELEGTFTEVRGAGVCVKGNDGSQITLHDSYLHDCDQTLNAVNGAWLDRSILEGGTSVAMMGGVLKMTDSVIDLMHDRQAPDCTKFTNTSVELSHVRFTGCHCPIHFNSGGEADIIIEDSVFDGATYPVMAAKVRGSFARNHFEGTSADFLDIGGSIDLDIADNYYGGGAPEISGGSADQFKNRQQFRSEPVPGVGPRSQ